jgi:hypothetical protein
MSMKHPRRALRDPLKGAALTVRQSRPGGALGGASPLYDMFTLSRSPHFNDLSEEVGGSGSLP